MDKLREEWWKYSQRETIDDINVRECIDDAANFFISHFTSLLTEIEGEIEKMKISDDLVKEYATAREYNQALTDILSIINNYKKLK